MPAAGRAAAVNAPGDSEASPPAPRLVDMTSDVFVELDDRGVLLDCNRRAEELLGWRREELAGRGLVGLLDDSADAEEVAARLAQLATDDAVGRPLQVVDLALRARDGRRVVVEGQAWAEEVDGRLVVRAFVQDVTSRRASEEALARAYLRDALTGLPSRTMFTYHLSYALARQRAEGTGVAVLLVDLDRFQAVNESFGHHVGDEVLVEVASRLAALVRPRDVVGRFGGDEFLVLVEGPGALEIARRTAGELLEGLRAPVATTASEVFVAASVGIACAREGDDVTSVLGGADTALGQAKRRGGARVELFDPGMRSGALTRMHTETSLHRALERGELEVYFQPVLSVVDRRVVGAEALVRWRHPAHGLLLPGEFMEAAEESGLIVPIGALVLESATRRFGEWAADSRATGTSGLGFVEVNLSARQLADPRVVDMVGASLASSGVAAERLVLEITESALMVDPDTALGVLRRLKRLGVRLALDDFGTGFSSLSYLRRFPLDVLKVDKSFVADLLTSPEDEVIVATVVTLAHTLGLEVVAEGVETEGQLWALESMGCDYYQGFLCAPAVSFDELLGLVERALPERG